MQIDEVIAFLRGTRRPAPPGPKRPRVTILLVLASLLHLPIVYLLVAGGVSFPSVTLLVGLLSIGLAWCGGVSLEGRRPGTVRTIAGVGLAEGILAFVPAVAAILGGARWIFLGIALLSGLALWLARR